MIWLWRRSKRLPGRAHDEATPGDEARRQSEGKPLSLTEDDLAPLAECLRPDDGGSLDEEGALPLLQAIESALFEAYEAGWIERDAHADAALEWLTRHFPAEPSEGPVLPRLHFLLRVFLHLNRGACSRQDVRRACNKIRRSIARHGKSGGETAYLDFIGKYVAGGPRS